MQGSSSRVAQIAQSDKWTALQRVMVVVGIPALLTFGGLILNETIQNGKEVASHSTKIDDIKGSVDDIKKETTDDHDHLSRLDGLILVINSKLEQLPLIWQALSRGRDPQPANKPPP